jgi:chromate transporter
MSEAAQAEVGELHASRLTLFLVFLRLGLTSFGGAVAHLGYFRTEFVSRRRWLSDQEFGDIVALCQLLPGPASSQTGITIGLIRGGLGGAVAAWLGFALPSIVAMIAFGYLARGPAMEAWARPLHGLLVVAVAVVAQATLGMARSFTPDWRRGAFALGTAILVSALRQSWIVPAAIVVAGLLGWRFLPHLTAVRTPKTIATPWPRWVSNAAGFAFAALLMALPIAAQLSGVHAVAVVDRFYRVGAMVFGGGHVVLPLLSAEVVPQGWVSNSSFMAGYGAVQALPGPLFTFAAYLGTVMNGSPSGWLGGLIAVTAIFLPSFLMVIAIFPHFSTLRGNRDATAVLAGVNAAVVGLLLAALYNPVWTSAIHAWSDFVLAAAGFAALQFARAPSWTVVLGTVTAATLIG